MDTFQPHAIINTVVHKLGLDTWPLGIQSIIIPIFLVVILSIYYRPGSPKSATTTNSAKKMAVKPDDGSVHVSEIFVHPIKSCHGTSVQKARYNKEGLENDRKWCIIDATTKTVITAREFPKMVLITPRIDDAHDVLVVSFPDSSGCATFSVPLQPSTEILRNWEIIDNIGFFSGSVDGYICQALPLGPSPNNTPSQILSTYFTKPVHLVYKGPRVRAVDTTFQFPDLKASSVFQDMYPLLVLSEESMGAVEHEVRQRIGQQGIEEKWKEERMVLRRFRPNIVFSGGGPFAEDQWETIALGSATAPKITLVSKCARCLLPNVSPETGERDKAVPYKVIMKFRTGLDPLQKMAPCVGCNAVPEANGVVSVGDVVYVKKMLE